MNFEELIKHTKIAFSRLEFLRGSVLQVLAWPILSLILVTALWYWVNATINTEKHTIEKKALEEATQLSVEYEKYLTQVIDQANQVTLQLQYNWEKSQESLNLAELSQGGIFRSAAILNVIIINQKGLPVTSTFPVPQGVTYADREYFVFHKNDDTNLLLVGRPIISRSRNRPVITFTRRLNTPHGEFNGVADVAFDPDYLTDFFAGAFPGKSGLLAVAGLDGVLRSVRLGNQHQNATLPKLRTIPLFATPEGVAYISEDSRIGDKLARYVAWRTLKEYPLVAMVGIPELDYLAPYQATWSTYRSAATIGSLITFLFAIVATGMSLRIARKKFQEHEQRKAYRIATEGGNEGFYMYEALHDKNGSIVDFQLVDCNPQGAEFYGAPQTQFLHTRLSSCYPEIYFNELIKVFLRAMNSGFYEDEIEVSPDSMLKIRWAKRRFVRSGSGLAVTIQDITERKQAEKLLAEYAAIVESTDDAIVGKTLDGIISSWNMGAEHMFGYRADEIIGHSIVILIPEERRSEELEILEKIRHGESIKHYETVRRSKEGRLIDVSVTVSPLKNPQGEIVGASKIARDITEHKQAEEELRRYRDQLEEKVEQRTAELLLTRDAADAANKAKSMFLANMSHELRTPLNAILGFSSLLRRDTQLTEKQRDNLDIINRSGEHLLTLINDVLEIAKIEAGRLQLEIAPFDLGSMVRDVVDMMQVRAQDKGLTLLLDQSSEFPRYIKGDEIRLRQILVNLLGNAVKFTEQGGVVMRLGIKENAHHHLLIEIEDTGPGINPEDQQRIFQPFVQLTESGEQKGTGLGLTITRQFVQMMGGTIVVESTPGKGARFRVDLPVELAGAADVLRPQQKECGEVIGLVPGQPHYRILIAEDQRDNQLLLSRLMTSLGVEVKIAENGEQCIKLFQEWHPDLIWMDRRMPVMDGEKATRRIRQLPEGNQVKIVAVTASAFKEEQQQMLDAGMNGFIRKPYRIDEIYDCLAQQLGLQYLYQTDMTETPAPATLTPAMLAVLPDDMRHELRDALESLDGERLTVLLQQVKKIDAALGRTLNQLAEYFDYPAILGALNEQESLDENRSSQI